MEPTTVILTGLWVVLFVVSTRLMTQMEVE